MNKNNKIFAIAPMMDWTDRHCRYFHRLLTKHALLYTEMVVADALIHGDVPRHLDFGEVEHPVALQLGGSEPGKLVQAAKTGAQWGYDEINLNVGCPSDRVQSGTFGACLMREPQLVADCVAAMKGAVDVPVTVKCRIGVDDQDSEIALNDLANAVFDRDCDGLWVHARKAWLQGLSPKENRDVPPLDYGRVHRLKEMFPERFIGINGGLQTLQQASDVVHEAATLDGAMLGRVAYQSPTLLLGVDEMFYGVATEPISMEEVCSLMMDYAAKHIQSGGRLHHITRHMIGLFQGRAGARRFRQILSVEASAPGADERVIERAFMAMTEASQAA